MPGQPTDDQLATMVRHLARLHVEIERGLRPPEQLRPYLAPAAYQRLRGPEGVQLDDPAPARSHDLGDVHLTRLTDRKVLASITTREQHDRHGALAFELQASTTGRWRITEITRLDRHHAVHRTAPSSPANLTARIRHARDERSAVAAAHRVETKRAPELTGAGADRAHALAAHWQQRLADLDRELADLRRQQQLRHQIPDRNPTAGGERDPAARLLGPEPEGSRQQRLYTVARDEIERYRDRWDIHDDQCVLGPAADNPEQARHRARVVELVRTVTPQLEQDRAEQQAPERASPDLAR